MRAMGSSSLWVDTAELRGLDEAVDGGSTLTDAVNSQLLRPRLIAPALGVFVLAGAASSQLSAAVADSIDAGGPVDDVLRRKISLPLTFTLAAALSYGLQSVLALSYR